MKDNHCENCSKLAREIIVLQIHLDSVLKSNNSLHETLSQQEPTVMKFMKMIHEKNLEIDKLRKELNHETNN